MTGASPVSGLVQTEETGFIISMKTSAPRERRACATLWGMLLAVDIGNTQTSVGLFAGAELKGSWAFTTRSADTADEVHFFLSGQFGLVSQSLAAVDAVVIASVVPPLTQVWAEVARRVTGAEALVVDARARTGLAMRYDNPVEIGADRLADAVAAVALVGAPVVVVDLGTATNMEVVDADGAFLGGVIAPGLAMGADALASRAAKLPQVDLSQPARTIGRNTVEAMHAGIIYGEVARIDGLVRRIFSELGYEAPVIATGGFSACVAGLSETITRREPLLTLQGLRLIHEKNHVEAVEMHLGRDRRIPFDVSADPFYSEANVAVLRERIADVEAGRNLVSHDDDV